MLCLANTRDTQDGLLYSLVTIRNLSRNLEKVISSTVQRTTLNLFPNPYTDALGDAKMKMPCCFVTFRGRYSVDTASNRSNTGSTKSSAGFSSFSGFCVSTAVERITTYSPLGQIFIFHDRHSMLMSDSRGLYPAFTICFFVALVLHYGGNISIIALIGIAIFILIRSQVMYKKRKAKEKGNETLKQLMQTADSEEALQLMRKHTREELAKVLEYAETNFELTVTSFIHENLRGLRRAMGSTKFEKQLIKQMKRTGTVAMCRLDNNTVLEKGLYYYQGNDFASELVYSISRLCEPCLEHIDNNFNPLDAIQKGEFSDVAEDITYLIQQCRKKLENNDYQNMEEEIRRANDLNGQLSLLKRKELQRIQSQSGSIRVSMVYLTMVQEAQNVVTYTINLMKVSRKFQMETEMP